MTDIKPPKEIPLREHFDHEEHDFTPWLLENLHLLQEDELLGFRLENPQREVNIGSYNADIVAEGVTNDRTVIIENEYNSTDHDHLGKSLVYAAGAEADVVVWIAETFTPEHTRAIQMLNRRTDDELAFFGIEAGLKQIGDSPYAIDFIPVVRPDNWSPINADKELSATEQSQLQFWEQFRSHLREQGYGTFASRQARASASYHISIGFSEAYIRPTARFQDETLYCAVRVTDRDGEFAGLEEEAVRQKIQEIASGMDTQQIQQDIADTLTWNPNPEGKYDTIRVDYGEANFADTQWADYHQWLAEIAEVFNKVLTKQLQ
jgi:hypothetical protein